MLLVVFKVVIGWFRNLSVAVSGQSPSLHQDFWLGLEFLASLLYDISKKKKNKECPWAQG